MAYLGEYRASVEKTLATVEAMPYEPLRIRSHDGLSLFGRLYSVENAIGTVVLFHGYRSYGENDFSGIFSYYMQERRCHVLLVDQRAHGESEGKYITFGIHERRDCVAWATYLAERFGASHKIVLDGMSMGAATVMMASAEALPRSVVGIIADCGYSTPVDILCHVGRRMRLPLPLIMPGVMWLCRVLAHFDPYETSAMAAVAQSPLPKLFVHGTADDFVPYEMGERLFAAAGGEKKMVSVEGADHGMSFLVSPEQVLAALTEFFDTYVGK
ncbi:MAG: alpha/beta hydrolase [Clostridia bacterium]|nr:alpha/beta hydrolase [Clostridia bacterium]